MTTLSIQVECGLLTCATPGKKMCRFAGATHFGTRSVCMLFPSDEHSYTRLDDKDGWLQRTEDCLNSEDVK